MFAAYRKHEAKNYIMLWTYLEGEFLADLEMGVIDSEDLLKDIVTAQKDEVEESFKEISRLLAEYAGEMELQGQDDIYIDVYENDDGEVVLSSPEQFSKQRAENLVGYVERGIEIESRFFKFMDEHPAFKTAYIREKRMTIKD